VCKNIWSTEFGALESLGILGLEGDAYFRHGVQDCAALAQAGDKRGPFELSGGDDSS
jgi:hypothetical protein